MRIAIIGAGVSGLVAAHLLHPDHDVTLFEANDYAGGHTHTVPVETEAGRWDVDTGFIVHNDRNYPQFRRLLGRLRVETQATEMSFSVSDAVGDFEYNGSSPNGLYAKRSHLVSPAFQRMVGDLLRFNREARDLLAGDSDVSLRDYLAERRYSPLFVERLIVPQAAAVWSADPARMWSFPARFMVEFFANHGMLGFRGRPQWHAIKGGSRRYVEEIVRPLGGRVRLRTPIRALARSQDGVTVTPWQGEPLTFDHAIVATHSDQALRMLGEQATDRERELLGAFPYQANDVVLHTDRGLLPRRRRAWASWNYHLSDRPLDRSTVTYHMSRLQSLRGADREFCVTLNRSDEIRREHVLASFRYDHPVFTPAGVAAQRRWDELDDGRVSYCGAYWGWGFHEDGVVSGLRACARFGVKL